MATYKTPGVFIEEVPRLGSSIAGVPTAITGFVGYTEKAIIDGVQWPYTGGVASPPVRITSLLEFQQIFGGPFNEQFKAVLTGVAPSPTTVTVVPTTSLSKFILFYQVQMFYANGGGTCYISSVGSYTGTSVAPLGFANAVSLFEQVDEVTILSVPEAVFFTTLGDRKIIYERMIQECAKMQDRIAVLDTVHVGTNTIFQDAQAFRNNDVGADSLKYAATYYPALNTPLTYSYKDTEVAIDDNRTGSPIYTGVNNKSLFTVLNGKSAFINVAIPATLVATDVFKLTLDVTYTLTPGTSFPIAVTAIDNARNIADAINNHPSISKFITATFNNTATLLLQSKLSGAIGNAYVFNPAPSSAVYTPPGATTFAGGADNSADKELYNRISAELAKYKLVLYPSASMAGVYARVDAERGVWKAPANVGLSLVIQPSIAITDEDQQDLNVDSTSGKSINAIREFVGRGTLVWGARTLAGNDNEWRYINVRRLFTFVEESSKKATEFVVFESNTANTWQRVKGMIEAFLTGLWRDGALAGATPKDAFFVRVGLGTTMTAQDILEGKMIVEIGMAASRPAEFIILRFEHKLQES